MSPLQALAILSPNTTGWEKEDYDAHDAAMDGWFESIRRGFKEREWEVRSRSRHGHNWQRVFAWLPVPLRVNGRNTFAWLRFVDRQLFTICGRDQVGYQHIWNYCKDAADAPNREGLFDEKYSEWAVGNVTHSTVLRIKNETLSRLFGTLFRIWWD